MYINCRQLKSLYRLSTYIHETILAVTTNTQYLDYIVRRHHTIYFAQSLDQTDKNTKSVIIHIIIEESTGKQHTLQFEPLVHEYIK